MRLIIFTFLALLVGSAHSEITVGRYQDCKDAGRYQDCKDSGTSKVYIGAMGDAFYTANIFVKRMRKTKPIYCPPPKSDLDLEIYVKIIDDELQAVAYNKEIPLSYVMQSGLIRKFPCSK